MIKLFNYFLQSIIIYFFFIFGKIIGINLSRKLFSLIFRVFGPIFKSKNIIERNLTIFKENISEIEKKNITSNMWKNYGMTFIEYMFLGKFKNSDEHVKIFGEQNLENILKKKEQIIFVSGHFANFELMSMEISKKNIKLATIYRPLNNPFLNPLMEHLRKKFVCKNQIKKGINGVREAINYIKKGFNIALMIDQRVSEGEKIPFFSRDAFTTTLPAQLSLKYNLHIIPVFIERINDSDFVIKFENSIDPSDYKNKLDLTNKLNRVLEELIQKNPNQWIWSHNRWK